MSDNPPEKKPKPNAFQRIMQDQPIAYHPLLARMYSVTVAVLISQSGFWMGKGKDPDGWIYKTQAELTRETGLTRYQQEGARRKARKAGILEEERRGLPAKLYYRLNLQQIESDMDDLQDCTSLSTKDAVVPHTKRQQTSKPLTVNAGTTTQGVQQGLTQKDTAPAKAAAAEGAGASHGNGASTAKAPRGDPTWQAWCDLHDEAGLTRPARIGRNLSAAKEITKAISDPDHIKRILDRYLADADPFLKKNAHALHLLSGRVDAYVDGAAPKEPPRQMRADEWPI